MPVLAASKNRVYAIDKLGALAVLNIQSGARMDSFPAPRPLVPLANTDNDRIYLITETGLVQCLHDADLPDPIYHNANLPAAKKPKEETHKPAAHKPTEHKPVQHKEPKEPKEPKARKPKPSRKTPATIRPPGSPARPRKTPQPAMLVLWAEEEPMAPTRSAVESSRHGSLTQRENTFLAAQRPVIRSSFSGYRAPCTVMFDAAFRSHADRPA